MVAKVGADVQRSPIAAVMGMTPYLEYTLSCATAVGGYLAITFSMLFPVYLGAAFCVTAGLGTWVYRSCTRREGGAQAARQPSTSLHVDVFQDGGLEVEDFPPCALCLRTFALWYCQEEGLLLCDNCAQALHPRCHYRRTAHRVIPFRPVPGDVRLGATVWCVVLWETYRLCSVPAVLGIVRWFHCSETICDGRGTCGRYLHMDTSLDCSSPSYYTVCPPHALSTGCLTGVVSWTELQCSCVVLKNLCAFPT